MLRADTGEPIKGARVRLAEHAAGQNPHSYTAISDENGRFSMTGVVAARYRFIATRTGFVPQQFRPDGALAPAPVELSPGQKLEKALFRLTPAGVITGKITDEDGQPVAGVEMEALLDARQEQRLAGISGNEDPETAMLAAKMEMVPVGMGVTNDLGEYRMYDLPAADYYVAAIDSGMPELTEHSLVAGSFMTSDMGDEPPTGHPPMYYPACSRAIRRKRCT